MVCNECVPRSVYFNDQLLQNCDLDLLMMAAC